MSRLYEGVSLPDVEGANEALFADPLWQPGFSEIWDVRQIRELVASIEDVYHLATQELSNLHQSGTDRVAVIVARQIDYVMVQLYRYQVRGTGRPFQIFWRADEACAWLGVPTDVLIPPAL